MGMDAVAGGMKSDELKKEKKERVSLRAPSAQK